MSKSAHTLSGQSRGKRALSIVFAVISVVYLMPIFIVLMNAFKSNSAVNMDTFAFPNSETFMGWQNFIKGMTFGNYPFPKAVLFSFFITLVSAGLIHGGVVHCPGGQPLLQDRLLSLHLLHGGPLPDGDVHPGPDGQHREDPLL